MSSENNTEISRHTTGQNGKREKHLAHLFESSPSFVYVYKKTERLSMAVYMITDAISESEPLKNNVRETVLNLLTAVTRLKDKTAVEKENVITHIHEHVLQVVSLIDIAYTTGFISEMNAAVLKQEFYALVEYIKVRKKDAPASSVVITKDFFAVDEPSLNGLSGPGNNSSSVPRNDRSYEGGDGRSEKRSQTSVQDADQGGVNGSRPGVVLPSQPTNGVRNGVRNGRRETPRRGRISDYEAGVKKSERRSVIFTLLREKKEINVRDVARTITNCSEKTLQRELISMVKEGLLTKEGERRWSTYRLASSSS